VVVKKAFCGCKGRFFRTICDAVAKEDLTAKSAEIQFKILNTNIEILNKFEIQISNVLNKSINHRD
jgi:hypothetical protein